MKKLILLLFLINSASLVTGQAEKMSVTWKALQNKYGGENLSRSILIFRNAGTKAVTSGNWAFYFNSSRPLVIDSCPSQIRMSHIQGDLYRIEPAAFPVLQPGKSVSIPVVTRYNLDLTSDFPVGGHFVVQNKTYPVIINFIFPENPGSRDEKRPFVTSASRYESNNSLTLLDPRQLPPFLPEPVSFSYGRGILNLPYSLKINCDDAFRDESDLLREYLLSMGFQSQMQKNDALVSLAFEKSLADRPGHYSLKVHPTKGILLSAATPEGMFYAIQSLRSLLLKSGKTVTELIVDDYPRFTYRGLHLDVARNFQRKETVMQLLDRMALYKLNKLHFHLTDDEGWRLEINGLPELTAYGAYRGHTDDETEHLQPSLGSGPTASMAESSGCGFYNRSSFTEILKYAADRHIEVIPELDFPGHARAAIKAMDYRYRKYIKKGQPEEAMEYLLRDTADDSKFISVQNYSDNVINVGTESVFRFMKKVIDELADIYKDAGLKLNTLHMGGDEVPAGVWEKSPNCLALLESHPEFHSPRELQGYFMQRVNDLLALKNITMAGWEEIALLHSAAENQPRVNPGFASRDVVPFCWTFTYDTTTALHTRLANAGYKVVTARASSLYLDMAYEKDREEPGLSWANYLSTREVYGFSPMAMPGCPVITKGGDTLTRNTLIRNQGNLTDRGKSHLLGMEACLWGETILNPERLDYMLFPRLIAAATRAWSKAPVWENVSDSASRAMAFSSDYNRFANMLGQKELPMLDNMGIQFRIPPPGIFNEKGVIRVNVEFPGLPIRYSTYNKPLTPSSPQVSNALQAKPGLKIGTVMPSGRQRE